MQEKTGLARYERFAYLAVIGLVGFFICSPTRHDYFVADDFWCIQCFHLKSLPDIAKLFVADVKGGVWGENQLRPWFALSFRLDYFFSGIDPAAYRLTNILLHVLNAGLIFLIVTRLTNGRNGTAFIAGLLFVLAPVHSEPIGWITGGKSDTFATVFYLAAFLFFMLYRSRRRLIYYYLSLAVFSLGLFCKEILLTFPAMIMAYDLFFKTGDEDKFWRRLARRAVAYVPFFLVTLFYLGLRRMVFGDFAGEHAITSVTEFFIRQTNNFRRLWLPFYSYTVAEKAPGALLHGVTLVLEGVVIGLFLVWFLALLRRRSEYRKTLACIFYFGVVWYVISLAPLLVTYASTRHLYQPSCGVYIAMAFLLFPFASQQPTQTSWLRVAATAILLVGFGYNLVKANAEWSRAGAISQKARVDIERLVGTIPEGSVVVINVPLEYGGAMIWKWVLPYALQKPFSAQDLYSKFRIVEHPVTYCFPVEYWWEKTQKLIAALSAEGAADPIKIYKLQWTPEKAAVVLNEGEIGKETLRAQIEGLLRQPAEEIEMVEYNVMYEILRIFASVPDATNEAGPGESISHQDSKAF